MLALQLYILGIVFIPLIRLQNFFSLLAFLWKIKLLSEKNSHHLKMKEWAWTEISLKAQFCITSEMSSMQRLACAKRQTRARNRRKSVLTAMNIIFYDIVSYHLRVLVLRSQLFQMASWTSRQTAYLFTSWKLISKYKNPWMLVRTKDKRLKPLNLRMLKNPSAVSWQITLWQQ